MAEKEYIEVEAAKKAMCRMCEGGAKLVCGTLNGSCTTMRIFDSIPAADVRTVVRGVWNAVKGALHPAETSAVCSNCGFATMIHAQTFYNFCPNCGADMRETDDEKA